MENLVIDKQFWKNKRVLITGHTGFKGSWLSVWLQMLEAKTLGFSKNIPTNPSMFEIANVEKEMKSIFGDICDYKHLEKVISEFQPEIIFHMAAQSLVKNSYQDPIETFSTNVMGTVNLLEIIRNQKHQISVVNVTSDKCYKNLESDYYYKEDDPMGGNDPYSCSKGCAELVTNSFRNSFFNLSADNNDRIFLASVRAGNVIGGGDWSDNRLIPDVIRGLKNKTPVKIRNPNAIRPWQFILEPLNGYLLLAQGLAEERQNFSEGWNFGPSKEDHKPVSWILEKLQTNWKFDLELVEEPFHESSILKLDCQKALTKLGWKRKVNLQTALEWTISWYEKYFKNGDLRTFSEEQIQKFQLLS